MAVFFCNPASPAPPGSNVLNVTSRSKTWTKRFSPMVRDELPLQLYGYESWTVENLWQYSRKYPGQDDSHAWNEWRIAGYSSERGVRYPMGRGAVPEFSFITRSLGRMGLVAARKAIYIPAYFQKLQRFCWKETEMLIGEIRKGDLWIWDFDVTNNHAGSWESIVADETRSMGHGFVLIHWIEELLGRKLIERKAP